MSVEENMDSEKLKNIATILTSHTSKKIQNFSFYFNW